MKNNSVESHTHSITTDSAANVVSAINELRNNISVKDIIHIRCTTHIINIVVGEIFEYLDEFFEKIRYYCKKVGFYI